MFAGLRGRRMFAAETCAGASRMTPRLTPRVGRLTPDPAPTFRPCLSPQLTEVGYEGDLRIV